MEKHLLVVNAGSSSLKFRLYDWDLNEIASGICERVGLDGYFKFKDQHNMVAYKWPFPTHQEAIDHLLAHFQKIKMITDLTTIKGVGHRIVQGGKIAYSCVVDQSVLAQIRSCIPLAPLHNKPEADVLELLQKKLPNAKQVAVFDTAFHTTIPKINYYYPIPQAWIRKYNIKKYGFHGTSYRFVCESLEKILNKKPLNLIIAHLGNGASLCCIKGSKSYDTTMGFTPLSGLMMGTRCGDIDPSIVEFLIQNANLDAAAIFEGLNYASGLKSICASIDFRDIIKNLAPDNIYTFAKDLFIKRIVDYVAIYQNMLQHKVDALVFTGGIGENVPLVRAQVCEQVYGAVVDHVANMQKVEQYLQISHPDSKFKILVVPTNEELKIAQDTKACVV